MYTDAQLRTEVVQEALYSAQLMKIDLEQFKRETTAYTETVSRLEGIEDVADFNTVIKISLSSWALCFPIQVILTNLWPIAIIAWCFSNVHLRAMRPLLPTSGVE